MTPPARPVARKSHAPETRPGEAETRREAGAQGGGGHASSLQKNRALRSDLAGRFGLTDGADAMRGEVAAQDPLSLRRALNVPQGLRPNVWITSEQSSAQHAAEEAGGKLSDFLQSPELFDGERGDRLDAAAQEFASHAAKMNDREARISALPRGVIRMLPIDVEIAAGSGIARDARNNPLRASAEYRDGRHPAYAIAEKTWRTLPVGTLLHTSSGRAFIVGIDVLKRGESASLYADERQIPNGPTKHAAWVPSKQPAMPKSFSEVWQVAPTLTHPEDIRSLVSVALAMTTRSAQQKHTSNSWFESPIAPLSRKDGDVSPQEARERTLDALDTWADGVSDPALSSLWSREIARARFDNREPPLSFGHTPLDELQRARWMLQHMTDGQSDAVAGLAEHFSRRFGLTASTLRLFLKGRSGAEFANVLSQMSAGRHAALDVSRLPKSEVEAMQREITESETAANVAYEDFLATASVVGEGSSLSLSLRRAAADKRAAHYGAVLRLERLAALKQGIITRAPEHLVWDEVDVLAKGKGPFPGEEAYRVSQAFWSELPSGTEVFDASGRRLIVGVDDLSPLNPRAPDLYLRASAIAESAQVTPLGLPRKGSDFIPQPLSDEVFRALTAEIRHPGEIELALEAWLSQSESAARREGRSPTIAREQRLMELLTFAQSGKWLERAREEIERLQERTQVPSVLALHTAARVEYFAKGSAGEDPRAFYAAVDGDACLIRLREALRHMPKPYRSYLQQMLNLVEEAGLHLPNKAPRDLGTYRDLRAEAEKIEPNDDRESVLNPLRYR
jgi:hypothetical protein